MTPRLSQLRHHKGVAGQYSYSVLATYPGEESSKVEFIGSVYGGPVVMVTESWDDENGVPRRVEVFVDAPGRFGSKLDPKWIRRFFGEGEQK